MCMDPELSSGPAHSRPSAGSSCDLLSACTNELLQGGTHHGCCSRACGPRRLRVLGPVLSCSGLAWRTDGGWSGPSSTHGGPRRAAASWDAWASRRAFECQLYSLFAVWP